MVTLIFVAIECFLNLVTQLTLHSQAPWWASLATVLLQLPAAIYQLFPIAAMLGALLGLSQLTESNALTVIQAAGVSTWQIISSVFKTGLVLVLLSFLIGESIAPYCQGIAQRTFKTNSNPLQHDSIKGIWLYKNRQLTHINPSDHPQFLAGITNFTFNKHHQLIRALSASSGTLLYPGHYSLHHVTLTERTGNRVVRQHLDSLPFELTIQPNLLKQTNLTISQTSLLNLYQTIAYRKSNGLSTALFAFTFWQRLIQPMTTLVLILLASPFVLGSQRVISTSKRILSGISIGFCFFMLNQILGALSVVFHWPALLFALLPTALFTALTCVLIKRAAQPY